MCLSLESITLYPDTGGVPPWRSRCEWDDDQDPVTSESREMILNSNAAEKKWQSINQSASFQKVSGFSTLSILSIVSYNFRHPIRTTLVYSSSVNTSPFAQNFTSSDALIKHATRRFQDSLSHHRPCEHIRVIYTVHTTPTLTTSSPEPRVSHSAVSWHTYCTRNVTFLQSSFVFFFVSPYRERRGAAIHPAKSNQAFGRTRHN